MTGYLSAAGAEEAPSRVESLAGVGGTDDFQCGPEGKRQRAGR